MTPVEETSFGTLVFLSCGCGGTRGVSHPTGRAVLVMVSHPCTQHLADGTHVRTLRRGERVRPFVRRPVVSDEWPGRRI